MPTGDSYFEDWWLTLTGWYFVDDDAQMGYDCEPFDGDDNELSSNSISYGALLENDTFCLLQPVTTSYSLDLNGYMDDSLVAYFYGQNGGAFCSNWLWFANIQLSHSGPYSVNPALVGWEE